MRAVKEAGVECIEIQRGLQPSVGGASTIVPMVLYGGRGLSVEDFSRTAALGITKINVFIELALRGAERLRENLCDRPLRSASST